MADAHARWNSIWRRLYPKVITDSHARWLSAVHGCFAAADGLWPLGAAEKAVEEMPLWWMILITSALL